MKPKKARYSEVKYITLEELAAMIGITMPKKKKKIKKDKK